MRRFDLVLTYNWGAVDAVMARRTFTKGMPPLIHHEDGFNADEADHLKVERNMYRRIALGAATALVVPSDLRSEEHTSELQSLMRISYAVFCLTKKKKTH